MTARHIINATPHDVRVPTTIFDQQYNPPRQVFWRDAKSGLHLARKEPSDKGPSCYHIPSSGFRLPARADVTGPLIGCAVRYYPMPEAEQEVYDIRRIFHTLQGVTCMVIASEISVRSLGAGDIGDASLEIEFVWPVIAEEALRLPPSDRWVQAFAAVQVPVVNDAGVVINERAAWRWGTGAGRERRWRGYR